MARAIWSGALTFGLANVPVKLHTAVSQKEVRFHMLHAKDGSRIRMKRFCESEDREVAYDEIVKGHELSRGRHVTLSPAELESLDPKATRTIEIRDFVELAEIDRPHGGEDQGVLQGADAAEGLARAEHERPERHLPRPAHRLEEEAVRLRGGLLRDQVVAALVVDGVDLGQLHEVADLDGARRLRIEALELGERRAPAEGARRHRPAAAAHAARKARRRRRA